MKASDDTIVATSSPPGRSWRGLIRLAGPTTCAVLNGLGVADLKPRLLVPTRLRLDRAMVPALAVYFKAPHSYCGQDMAELQCPGNPALLERIIHRARGLGARLAEPGEFTFRAFLAGKIDLTQAEATAATISAVSDSQLEAARHLRRGQLGQFSRQLVEQVSQWLAMVEAGIDFVDQEDVVPIEPKDLDHRLCQVSQQLDDLRARCRPWGAIEALPQVVLAGPPSVGKSTLFNALLGRARAVVDPLAGTTRDVLAEPLTVDSDGQRLELMLIDMAGLNEPETYLDRQAVVAAEQAIELADVVVLLDDGCGRPRPKLPPRRGPTIDVRNKADLRPMTDEPLSVSAQTGQGLESLRQRIVAAVHDRAVSVAADMLALQPRHEAALNDAAAHLLAVRTLLAPQLKQHHIDHIELVADELRATLDALDQLGGQMTPDDIIGRIFSTFCIGK